MPVIDPVKSERRETHEEMAWGKTEISSVLVKPKPEKERPPRPVSKTRKAKRSARYSICIGGRGSCGSMRGLMEEREKSKNT